MGKLGEKPEENHQNGAEWRFIEGLKRHIDVLRADGVRSQTADAPDFTSVESGCHEPSPAP
jgi:hypothetical protein